MLPQAIHTLRDKPDQVLARVDYFNACSFVSGLFCESKTLFTFSDWLSLKLEKRSPFWWPGIILQIEFETETPKNIEGNDSLQKQAIASLISLLEEFLDSVDSEEAREQVKADYRERFSRN